MSGDDEKERKARADRLRKEIENLKSADDDEANPDDAEIQPRENESPRDFIHRKMHEADKARKG